MPRPLRPALAALESRLGLALGSLTEEDKLRAEAALDDAAVAVAAEVPDSIATRWITEAPAIAVLVVMKAARREYENPRGLLTEALDGHSVGLSDSSGVYLTAREVAQVRRAAYKRRGGFVGTVRTPSAYEED